MVLLNAFPFQFQDVYKRQYKQREKPGGGGTAICRTTHLKITPREADFLNNKVSILNVIKFAGAYVACAIGSGFATGQEIMQFFSAQGVVSIVGTIITTVLFAWCGGMFMKHGQELQLESPGAIVQYYFGERIGKIFEILFQIFLYGVYAVSYTHLDVYKRQPPGLPPRSQPALLLARPQPAPGQAPLSYTVHGP